MAAARSAIARSIVPCRWTISASMPTIATCGPIQKITASRMEEIEIANAIDGDLCDRCNEVVNG